MSRKTPTTSRAKSRSGTLYIVGVQIGNPDDITIRALATLKRVAVIASETPLATQVLLSHHHIPATVTSYGPHHLQEKIEVLLAKLKQGEDVAFVSDNGMPVIYDPGQRLIAGAHKAGLAVTVIPGPSTLTAAIALSGYSGDRLLFEGRLPHGRQQMMRFMEGLSQERRTMVFFVRPGTITQILNVLRDVFPARQMTLAVDLTKPNETLYQGAPDLALEKAASLPKSAECTVVLEGKTGKSAANRQHDGE
jgi:16S rRNA (cytidine1402-2'-O)-methyltransferase